MNKPAYVLTGIIILFCMGCKTPSILVTEEQRKGDYFNNLYDYNQAILHYENMLEASSRLGTYRNLDMEADVCRKIAHAYNIRGEFGRAVEYMERALSLDETQGNNLEIIEDLRELGKIFLYMGEFPRGVEYLKRALSLNEGMAQSIKGVNQLSLADTYLTLSRLYTVLGNFQQGEEYGMEAFGIYRNQEHKEGEMECLLQLGKIAVQTGSEETGEAYLTRSWELALNLGMSTYRHKEALARAKENKALYEEALRLKLEALDEARARGNLPQIIWAQMGTGDLYKLIGDQQHAMDHYQDALAYLDSSQIQASALEASANLRAGDMDQAYAFFSEAGSNAATGIAGLRLGEVALESKLWQKALDYFQGSFDHFSEAKMEDGMARTLVMSTICNLGLSRLPEARISIDRASEHVMYDETRWRMHYVRGMLNEALSEPDSAIEDYITSVEIIEGIRGNLSIEEYKSFYLEDKMVVYEKLIRLLMNRGKTEESFNYSERARARTFLDMMGSGSFRIRQDESSELVAMEQELKLEIQSLSRLIQKGDLSISRGYNRTLLEQEIFDAREEYQNVLNRIKLYNKEYGSMVNLETSDLSELISGMEPSTAFLVYWVGKEELYIWILSSEGIRGKIVPVGEDQITELVARCRNTVGTSNHTEIYNQAYQYLFKAVEEEIRGYETMGIVPHLSLHFLPYQCLMPDSDSYLVDRFNIFYAPSVNAYSLAAEKEIDPSEEFLALALGGLELEGLSGLPGTAKEVSFISTLFASPTVAFAEMSTESLFKSSVKPFEYVHLATHGILDPKQPMYSYLVLAPSEEEDGMLTVNEIFGLEMNARLVVLSACETALGSLNRGDEIIGLSRAFLYAGSRNVIVSLWSVADEPTSFLMNQFYRLLGEHDLAESLRMAQIETRKKYHTPVYWAPFQIIGSGH